MAYLRDPEHGADRRRGGPPTIIAQVLTVVLAAVMLLQSVSGRMFDGAYRDVEIIRSTWIGNDWITLLVGVPLLLTGLAGMRRGSIRWLLLWIGLLGYAVYNYAFYLFGAALNVFFPLYVAACVTATAALILALSDIDASHVARSFHARTPVRLTGGFLALVGVVLGCVWLTFWAAYIFAGRATPLDPEAFKLVAALDLVLMVPALTVGGVLLWRRHAWGYVLALIASTQGALYLGVLSVNSIIVIRRGLATAPGELPIWGPLAVLTAPAAIVLLSNVRTSAP